MIPIWISSVALSFSCEAVMPCEAKKYLDDYEGDDVYRHRTAQIRNSSRKELDVVSSIELLLVTRYPFSGPLTHKRLWDIQVES